MILVCTHYAVRSTQPSIRARRIEPNGELLTDSFSLVYLQSFVTSHAFLCKLLRCVTYHCNITANFRVVEERELCIYASGIVVVVQFYKQ